MSPAKAKNSDPLNAQQKRIVASALTHRHGGDRVCRAQGVPVRGRIFRIVRKRVNAGAGCGFDRIDLEAVLQFSDRSFTYSGHSRGIGCLSYRDCTDRNIFAFFGGKVAGQLEELFSSIPALVSDTRQWIDKQEKNPELKNLLVKYDVETRAKQFLSEKGDLIIEWSRKIALCTVRTGANAFRSLVGWANWFVMPIYLIFLLMAKPVHKEDMEGLFPFCKEETRRDIIYLGEEFVNQVVTFFVASSS